ncbi:MAG: transcriptional repressor [Candidatus Cloacimonetes bacterium]|nr:transcriptional repressor [Candidatus Cloacimonadota bacterium]
MEYYLNIIKQNNLKLTLRRIAVIKLLLNEHRLFTVAEVRHRLKNDFSRVGLPTVYRILQQFREIGLVQTALSANDHLRYFICTSRKHDHHHFICSQCDRVYCLDYCQQNQIEKYIETELHARADYHYLQIVGLCEHCRLPKAQDSD